MLKKFYVRNYKNFKDTLVVDFSKVGGYQFNTECITNNTIGKSIIYGRNATGKTNLGRALMDIKFVISNSPGLRDQEYILNADSEETSAVFHYEFLFNNVEIMYEYSRKLNFNFGKEMLIIDGKKAFELDYDQKKFIACDLNVLGIESLHLDRYMEVLEHDVENVENEENIQFSFARFILNNSPLMPDSPLRMMENFVRGMSFIGVNSQVSTTQFQTKLLSAFTRYIDAADNLMDFQHFLNIMGVDCELNIKELPDGNRELYFNHDKQLPFWKTASSGTRALTNLYCRFIFMNSKVPFVFLDEFDAFFHYEMSENIVNYFKKYCPESQVVMTTHNTNLMTNHIVRPDCVFILSTSGQLTALCDATERELREGHNLEKLYIGGEFEKYE